MSRGLLLDCDDHVSIIGRSDDRIGDARVLAFVLKLWEEGLSNPRCDDLVHGGRGGDMQEEASEEHEVRGSAVLKVSFEGVVGEDVDDQEEVTAGL